jgi:galactokinase
MNAHAELIARTSAGFVTAFGTQPDILVFAPGRVNLIGEHTDYNDGFVLPCAIPFGTMIAMSRRNDMRVEAVALDLDSRIGFTADHDIAPAEPGHWSSHVRGIVAGLGQHGFTPTGANIAVAGNVPHGAGLSSSASLGVALGYGLSQLAGQDAPDLVQIARLAQWSEHHHVGCACGIMDQLASACGQNGHALLIDCENLAIRPVALPADTAIIIVHSGIQRELAESAYNVRREQCERAAHHYGVTALRGLDTVSLQSRRAGLDETAFARARHVVTENDRTLRAAKAFERGDLASLGIEMRASHASLRDDFEVSLPPIDALVECLNTAIGDSGGARMTGGGFGGCVVGVLATSKLDDVYAALGTYWAKRGEKCQLLITVSPVGGAHLVEDRRRVSLA